MFLLYNILHFIFLPVFAPLFFIYVLITPRYRGRIPARLGFGLKKRLGRPAPEQMTIWVHALSVGEVTSAVPLLKGLKKKYPAARIVLTVSTRSGEAVAHNQYSDLVDHIIPAPLDLLPVIAMFFSRIQPQMFILVETDFWPNILLYLRLKKIPLVLVNGRVSAKAMAGYKRFSFFFQPMFHSFTYLFMQTKLDQQNMALLGIDNAKIKVLGNLKYDIQEADDQIIPISLTRLIPKGRLVIIAGSTHPGEEEIIFDVFQKLLTSLPQIMLILAPRNPARKDAICSIAKKHNLSINLRSQNHTSNSDILLVDSIGELISFYGLSDIAFVGGSLVDEGGHNPIEPAVFGIPVLFGPFMQDFHEIAHSLVSGGAAQQIDNPSSLQHALTALICSKKLRDNYGTAAKECISLQGGVIDKHLTILNTLL